MLGEMLVGRDGDIMLEASTWKQILAPVFQKIIHCSNNLNYVVFIELICNAHLIFISISILLKHSSDEIPLMYEECSITV